MGNAPSAKPLFRSMRQKDDTVPLLDGVDLPPKRSDPPREELDHYPTPVEAIRSLLWYEGERIAQADAVWEPCCGAGNLVNEMREFGLRVSASDIVDRGCPDGWVADFFTCRRSRGQAIITNPPFDQINARDGHGRWLRHTFEQITGWDYLALLLPIEWEAARKNGFGELLGEHPYSTRYLMRWKLDFTGGGNPPNRHAWFIWDRHDEFPMRATRYMDKMDWREDLQMGLDLSGAE
ncbi:MAG: hypothetical protein AAGF71_12895 [Pseudomonadota bacterium]